MDSNPRKLLEESMRLTMGWEYDVEGDSVLALRTVERLVTKKTRENN